MADHLTGSTVLEPVVIEATRRAGGAGNSQFSTYGFGSVVQQAFGLRERPEAVWCEDVLGQLPFVTKEAGGCMWRYRPASWKDWVRKR